MVELIRLWISSLEWLSCLKCFELCIEYASIWTRKGSEALQTVG